MPEQESLALPKGYRMKEARKLFGFALRHSAEETYEAIERPDLNRLSRTTSLHVAEEYTREFGTRSEAQDLFLYGIVDTMRLVVPIIKMHRSLPKEVALQIARHPSTIASHAVAANQPQARAEAIIYGQPGIVYDLSEQQDSIEIIGEHIELRADRGCEAVTYVDGQLEAEPIFQRFTTWAGELAVHSYFDHLSDTPSEASLF